MNLNCNLVDIIWIERGILLMIIYFIIKNYNNLEKKKIAITNKEIREFFKNIFLNLDFVDSFEKSKNDFFYFNIRSIKKEQDIIVDYLKNYDDFIPTKKIWLVPYYDLNDPLIIYKYNKKSKLDANLEKEIIKNFNCPRGNYLNSGVYWDIYFENTIINKAKEFGILNVQNLINNYFIHNFVNTKIQKPNLTNFVFPVINYTNRQSQFTKDLKLTEEKIEKTIGKIEKPIEKTIGKIEKPIEEVKIFDKIPQTSITELENKIESKNRKKMINLMNIIGEKIENLNNLNNIN